MGSTERKIVTQMIEIYKHLQALDTLTNRGSWLMSPVAWNEYISYLNYLNDFADYLHSIDMEPIE